MLCERKPLPDLIQHAARGLRYPCMEALRPWLEPPAGLFGEAQGLTLPITASAGPRSVAVSPVAAPQQVSNACERPCRWQRGWSQHAPALPHLSFHGLSTSSSGLLGVAVGVPASRTTARGGSWSDLACCALWPSKHGGLGSVAAPTPFALKGPFAPRPGAWRAGSSGAGPRPRARGAAVRHGLQAGRRAFPPLSRGNPMDCLRVLQVVGGL